MNFQLKQKLPEVLPAPEIFISENAKWLAGEGAGSWFIIEAAVIENEFSIKRLSPSGVLECEGIFTADSEFYHSISYAITYPSHCAKVTVMQGEKKIVFTRN